MKVLFAVSTENIAERIIKTYQKEHKEIISSKNVYYFNAIIKELQKNQTYDRIVISEDLEPFTNNNYDAIDKFIFEKLDRISDEAINVQGRDIPIVVICSERREKSDNLLVKLFSIGVYDALVGNDRSIESVCNLLKKPRTKKEAKAYYKIEQGEYENSDEKNVSEVEIQNILSHYRKIGKNEGRYVESFNSIAEQYNEEQLKIIIKFLPMEVKAVLEANSPKYQSIMTYTTTVPKEEKKSNLNVSKIVESRAKKITGPVIIPSAVKTNNVRKISQKDVENTEGKQDESLTVKPTKNLQRRDQESIPKIKEKERTKTTKIEKVKVVQNRQEVKTIEEKAKEESDEYNTNAIFEELEHIEGVQPITPIEPIVPMETQLDQPVKRGRGRPRKVVSEAEQKEVKPKRGRGRPRKNPIVEPGIEEEEINQGKQEEVSLSNYEEITEIPGFEELENTTKSLGFFEDNYNDNELPGFEDEEDEVDSELPGFEDEEDEDDSELPGFEDEEDEDDSELPGFEDEEDEDDSELPGFEDEEDEDDSELPGFEDEEDEDDSELPGFEDEEDEDDSELAGFEDEEDDSELPRFENEEDESESEIPGFDTEDEELSTFQKDNKKAIFATPSFEMTQKLQRTEDEGNPIDISYLLTQDKKMVAFVGTSKNGVSFLVDNVAEILSSKGIKTAIVDLTKNKNSYYIYTKNREELREAAYASMENLKQGNAVGIEVNNNLTVYTSSPNIRNTSYSIESMLTTLAKNYSLVLLDCDYSTNKEYFRAAQEIYLVQSMDVLTIQPLTEFLRRLKLKEVLQPEKLRAVINKALKVKNLNEQMIVGGMSTYNDPEMSIQDRLFDMNTIKTTVIPFDIDVYSNYLSGIANCDISTRGYNKTFLHYLTRLAEQVYPEVSNGANRKNMKNIKKYNNYEAEGTKFSQDMNNTLSQMKKQYK